MRSFVVTMLFAAVIAEDGYTCTDSDSTWVSNDLSSGDVTTADECKTACDGAVSDDGTTDNDWCCHAVAVADPVSLTCSIYSITAAELDIRAAEEEAVDGTTNSAWAWGAGVALEDLAEEEVVEEEDDDEEEATEEDEEDDEDMSVRMTASAVAAASIAMLAM